MSIEHIPHTEHLYYVNLHLVQTCSTTPRASRGHTMHNAEQLKVFTMEIGVYIDNHSIVINFQRYKQHGLCARSTALVCSLSVGYQVAW